MKYLRLQKYGEVIYIAVGNDRTEEFIKKHFASWEITEITESEYLLGVKE